MNLNSSSGAVGSDRSLGLANAPGYFWQLENPQNMKSFHISILSNYLSRYMIHSIREPRRVEIIAEQNECPPRLSPGLF